MATSVQASLESQAGTYDEVGDVTADCSEAATTERKRRSIARHRRATSFTIGIEAKITTKVVEDVPPEETTSDATSDDTTSDTTDTSDSTDNSNDATDDTSDSGKTFE